MKKVVTQITSKSKEELESSKGKIKVAAYCRVSTEKDEQLNSLEVQRKYFDELIASHSEWEYVEVYYDEGISGTSTKKRTGFNKMIADALAGKIDMIIVKSISRFARNTVDSIQTIRNLKDKGVKVYFEKENIDSDDIKSEFMLTIMSSLAQEESQSVSENVKWSKRKGFAEGKVSLAYKNFLGYKQKGKHTMEIDYAQAKIVVTIYKMFLEGHASTTICAFLNMSNVPTPTGNPKARWTKNNIFSILSNEKYCGNAILQKTFVESFITHKIKKNTGELPQYFVKNNHESIISLPTWKETQDRLKVKKVRSMVTPFGFFLRCNKCGAFYLRRSRHHEFYAEVIWIYCCSKRFTHTRCKNIILYEKQLFILCHEAVITLFNEYSDIKKYLFEAIQKTIDGKRRQNRIIKEINNYCIENISAYEKNSFKVFFYFIEVFQDKKLVFHAINGKCYEMQIPYFSLVDNYGRSKKTAT